jgi:hypothetical protein
MALPTTTADTFSDFDDAVVYREALDRNQRDVTRNFIVEFGADKARIAFDFSTPGVAELLKATRSQEFPVRWM